MILIDKLHTLQDNAQVTVALMKYILLGFGYHSLQVTRIDGTVDSPPCLKVTHKTFGTQNSNNEMVYCRLSMPVEFYSADKFLDESLKLRSDIYVMLPHPWRELERSQK